jgi:predicted ester cyclase
MLKKQAEKVANPKQVMHKFFDLFESGNWDEFDQVIAIDCILHYPGGVEVVGIDAMKAGWQKFYGSMQDMSVTPLAEISEGDTLMAFFKFTANFTGEYLGQQVTGLPIQYNQVEMVRVEDEKIVEWWVEMDRLWMAEQLGFSLGLE